MNLTTLHQRTDGQCDIGYRFQTSQLLNIKDVAKDEECGGTQLLGRIFFNLRLISSLSLCFVVSSGSAASEAWSNSALRRHAPLHSFVVIADSKFSICESPMTLYWMEKSLRNPSAAQEIESKLRACVNDGKGAQRQKLLDAVEYTKANPRLTNALKNLYLRWTTSMDSLVPVGTESESDYARRQSSQQTLRTEALNALLLELELAQ